jgi:citrate lyase beta subunit
MASNFKNSEVFFKKMIRNISAISLGATLYVPAIHKNIFTIANEHKYPQLHSAVFCTEDSILDRDIPVAFHQLFEMLQVYKRGDLKLFFRPRSVDVLKQMLLLENIEKIDGFVLPKFDISNMQHYFDVLKPYHDKFHIMPVLESRALFDIRKLEQIRSFLLGQNEYHILSLRLGGEDMLRFLSLKRKCTTSLYDLAGPNKVIAEVLNTFKPYGFNISAPVYNCIKNQEFYALEVQRDIEQGFIGKTIIHPSQIEPLNSAYKVTNEELTMATSMMNDEEEAIVSHDGIMGEKFAHQAWAALILERANFYGIKV